MKLNCKEECHFGGAKYEAGKSYETDDAYGTRLMACHSDKFERSTPPKKSEESKPKGAPTPKPKEEKHEPAKEKRDSRPKPKKKSLLKKVFGGKK